MLIPQPARGAQGTDERHNSHRAGEGQRYHTHHQYPLEPTRSLSPQADLVSRILCREPKELSGAPAAQMMDNPGSDATENTALPLPTSPEQ